MTDFQEIPTVMPPEPSLAKNAMLWFGDYWSVAGMIGLAGVSLVMLRSLVKSAPPFEPSARCRGWRTCRTKKRPNPTNRRPSAYDVSRAGPSLRDEISALVKEDPDTAANILKTWIGHRRDRMYDHPDTYEY